jgi:DNA polymerase I
MSNDLIYGKNQTQKIVSIEPNDEQCTIFTEENGSVSQFVVPNRYWVLAADNLDGSFTRLNGSLYYKYGKQFKSRTDYISFKKENAKKDLYSVHDAKESLMLKDGYTYFKGMNPSEVSILSFDIETTGLNPEARDASVLLISNTLRINGKTTRKLFAYSDYTSSFDMILDWCNWVREMNPSIICGHNIYSFDLVYLSKYAQINGGNLNLGRDGSEIRFDSYEAKFRVDGTRDLHYNKVRCYGRELVDTMFLAYKYDIGRKYESYGLKKIIAQEGLEAKDRIFYDAAQIRFKYKDLKEWELIKQYCLHDADDALKLYDLMAPPFFYMTQSVPKSFQSMIESASGSQINSVMVRGYLQEKHSIPKASPTESFEGGISFGIPGIYRNCWKVDIKSAYPSSVLIYRLYDKYKDPNANMLKLCEHFTYKRFEYKKLYKETGDNYYQSMDGAAKIFINSIFGFCGAPGLNFNSPKVAAKITESTRDFLEKAMVWATGDGKDKWLT